MACEKPNKAWQRGASGRLRFKQPEAGDSIGYIEIEVPCGTCILCREEYARQTAVKIHHESMMHEEGAFITLSYKDEHLPEHNSLNYEDIHRFWKRERQRLWRTAHIKLRHYTVGEYGDKTLRPHYHACVFGYGYLNNRVMLRETPTLLWTTPELEKAWGLGFVSVGALNYATASYTASYITKKLRSKQQYVRTDTETGELIPLEQPRAFMSDNLGKTWWSKYGKYLEDNDWVIVNGTRQKPPKTYDKWMKERDPDWLVGKDGTIQKAPKRYEAKLEEIKKKRKQIATENKKTPEQNRARANNAHARKAQRQVKI